MAVIETFDNPLMAGVWGVMIWPLALRSSGAAGVLVFGVAFVAFVVVVVAFAVPVPVVRVVFGVEVLRLMAM